MFAIYSNTLKHLMCLKKINTKSLLFLIIEFSMGFIFIHYLHLYVHTYIHAFSQVLFFYTYMHIYLSHSSGFQCVGSKYRPQCYIWFQHTRFKLGLVLWLMLTSNTLDLYIWLQHDCMHQHGRTTSCMQILFYIQNPKFILS